MYKLALYVIFTPLVLWVIEGININQIFKKNQELKAKIFYTLLVFIVTYLIVNCVYDLIAVNII